MGIVVSFYVDATKIQLIYSMQVLDITRPRPDIAPLHFFVAVYAAFLIDVLRGLVLLESMMPRLGLISLPSET